MSSLSSVSLSSWSRTMSTASQSKLETPTSTPHTSSSSTVLTGLKASLGTGPFFHARLQEGQRIEEVDDGCVRYQVSTFAIGPKGAIISGNSRQLQTVNEREESPRALHRHARERNFNDTGGVPSPLPSMSTPTAGASQQAFSKAKKQALSAVTIPMASDPNEYWNMVAEAQAAVNGSTPVPKRYHYITRSQSAGAAAEVPHVPPAPKLRKQNASYSPGFGTPAYYDSIDTVPSSSAGPWYPTRGRYLSPIEEVQSFPERHGETSSLHSTTSAQSNLFIHRSVRRTASASTINSGRSPDDSTSPIGVSPSRSYGQGRPVAALPVIPASPRESQNVFEQEPVPPHEASAAFQLPLAYPPRTEHPAYEALEEEDVGEASLSTLRFADPRHYSSNDGTAAQIWRDACNARASMPHSSTPSLLTRSPSVRTELTYLTAQNSATNSRRGSAALPDDLEGARRHSPPVDGDTTLVNTPKPSPVARLQRSISTLLSKSPKTRKSPGGLASTPTTDVVTSPKVAKLLTQMQDMMKKHAPWGEGKGKPAEVLFWTGFLAPWCWLIGGWMLARSGETMPEGLQRGTSEPQLRSYSSFSLPHKQGSQSPGMRIIPVSNVPIEKHDPEPTSMWQAAKSSSVELLDSLRGYGKRSREDVQAIAVRAFALNGDVPVPIIITTRVDPWVARCRVAAIVSGMLILALCIVALVVLIRSL